MDKICGLTKRKYSSKSAYFPVEGGLEITYNFFIMSMEFDKKTFQNETKIAPIKYTLIFLIRLVQWQKLGIFLENKAFQNCKL